MAGFAVFAKRRHGTRDVQVVSNKAQENTPNKWGHLQIPEFEAVLPVCAGTLLVICGLAPGRRSYPHQPPKSSRERPAESALRSELGRVQRRREGVMAKAPPVSQLGNLIVDSPRKL